MYIKKNKFVTNKNNLFLNILTERLKSSIIDKTPNIKQVINKIDSYLKVKISNKNRNKDVITLFLIIYFRNFF